MQIRSLSLSNFRIYKEAVFNFEESVNGIIGSNAIGKTTVLEAIYVALFGRSFRTTEIKDLIREGADAFRIEIHFIKNGIEQRISIVQGQKERRIMHNSTLFPQYSSLLGILHGVLIAPCDMDLIMGSPAGRRRFLDMQLSQIDPLYVHHLQRYTRAMKQRNFLLKSAQIKAIDPFEQEMAVSAAYITQQRADCVSLLSELSSIQYSAISQNKELLSIKFLNECPSNNRKEIEEFYLNSYKRLRVRELALGYTLSGPHKNDLSFLVNQKEARHFASEGQKHSLIASLKLGEWSLIAERSQQKPLLMIDDLSLSLDSFRQNELCKKITELGQSYFSTVSKPLFPFSRINWISIYN